MFESYFSKSRGKVNVPNVENKNCLQTVCTLFYLKHTIYNTYYLFVYNKITGFKYITLTYAEGN